MREIIDEISKIFASAMLVVCVILVHSEHAWSENAEIQTKRVIANYADIALANYQDSLATAKNLRMAVNQLVKNSTSQNLRAARLAWLEARIPYQQTEVFRFGNDFVDDWEGRVNSWPLDEGLIDYVTSSYGDESDENDLYTANVIANRKLKINGREIDASVISKTLLQNELHEAGGIEANVATGYHAIEFLLWGQDTNGTGPGAGNRPASDYSRSDCTGGNCDRRADYLISVTSLLIDDLTFMVEQWKTDGRGRKSLLNGSESSGLVAILTGMGSLSYGELAGERMKLGLILHDSEEEHDCFSDNTHNSHYYNVLGIKNIYLGRYKRVNGSLISGPGISDLVKAADPKFDLRIRERVDAAMTATTDIVKRAEQIEAYDQMIGEKNSTGNDLIQLAIDKLILLSRDFERIPNSLNLKSVEFQGSESVNPKTKALQQ